MDNVIPIYDLFEGNFYSIWQRIIIFGSIIFIIGINLYWWLRGRYNVLRKN